MVGFGPEDNHFVVELTYNYGIKEYKLGNDFQVILSNITYFYASWVGQEIVFPLLRSLILARP